MPADRLLHDRRPGSAASAVEIPVDRLDRTGILADDERREVSTTPARPRRRAVRVGHLRPADEPVVGRRLDEGHGRQPASQASVSTLASFTAPQDTAELRATCITPQLRSRACPAASGRSPAKANSAKAGTNGPGRSPGRRERERRLEQDEHRCADHEQGRGEPRRTRNRTQNAKATRSQKPARWQQEEPPREGPRATPDRRSPLAVSSTNRRRRSRITSYRASVGWPGPHQSTPSSRQIASGRFLSPPTTA